ncbi:MAG: ABC transporter permease [Roseiflexaceae bacterium]
MLLRKLLLLILLVPLLNIAGFYYAISAKPPQVKGQYGLMVDDQMPAFSQVYPDYARRLLSGDLGRTSNAKISTVISAPLRFTLILLGVALALTVLLGPLLGLLAVSPTTGRIRPGALLGLTVGSSLPGFFLGSLLITLLIYAARFGLEGGRGTLIPVQGTGLDARLILPALTLAARPTLYIASLVAGLLEHELQQDYIRVARSKGLNWRALLWRHALPNMAGTLVTAYGQSLRVLVSTLILVEALFDWRGLGRLLMQTLAISRNGYPGPTFLQPELMALLVMLLGGLILLADLVGSAIAYLADPRLRTSS